MIVKPGALLRSLFHVRSFMYRLLFDCLSQFFLNCDLLQYTRPVLRRMFSVFVLHLHVSYRSQVLRVTMSIIYRLCFRCVLKFSSKCVLTSYSRPDWCMNSFNALDIVLYLALPYHAEKTAFNHPFYFFKIPLETFWGLRLRFAVVVY